MPINSKWFSADGWVHTRPQDEPDKERKRREEHAELIEMCLRCTKERCSGTKKKFDKCKEEKEKAKDEN